MSIKSIRDSFLLCTVNSSKPRVSRSDKGVRKAAADYVHAQGGEFNDDKKVIGNTAILLYDPDSIRRVMTPYHSFITYHNAITCKYIGGKGSPALLSIKKQKEHSDRFYESFLQWQGLVNEWVTTYTDQVTEAKQRLGDRFDERDYPDPSVIAKHWQFTCQYLPIADPSSFPLGEFAEEQREAMESQLKSAMNRAADNATTEYRNRLRDALTKVASQLRNGKRLHESLLGNLQTLAGAGLNASEDETLTQALADIAGVEKSVGRALETREDWDKDKAASEAELIARKLAGV